MILRWRIGSQPLLAATRQGEKGGRGLLLAQVIRGWRVGCQLLLSATDLDGNRERRREGLLCVAAYTLDPGLVDWLACCY